MQSIGGGGLNPEAVDSDLIDQLKTNTFSLGLIEHLKIYSYQVHLLLSVLI